MHGLVHRVEDLTGLALAEGCFYPCQQGTEKRLLHHNDVLASKTRH